MALSLAKRGMGWTEPNPLVGSVIVKDGRIVSRGFHRKFGEAHAEAAAIEAAGERARGATLYVNLEPCCHSGKTPPCCHKIWKAGIKRVVASIEDPNPLVKGKGFAFLKEKGIEVIVGVGSEQAEELNRHFLWFHRRGRPWVTGKMAMTSDGATVWKEKWISSGRARKFAHWLRATHMGIMVGINTILNDNPKLNVRHPRFMGKKITKIILDSDLKINMDADVFKTGDRVIVFTASDRRFEMEGVEIIRVPRREYGLDLEEVLTVLAEKNIISVLVEGGVTLMSTLLKRGLLNELYLVHSAKLGGTHRMEIPPVEIASAKVWHRADETFTQIILKS